MPTPINFNETRGDMQVHKDIWQKKITEAEERVRRIKLQNKPEALIRTESEALLEVYRQYYDFLIDAKLTQEADKLLSDHPEIERTHSAAA